MPIREENKEKHFKQRIIPNQWKYSPPKPLPWRFGKSILTKQNVQNDITFLKKIIFISKRKSRN